MNKFLKIILLISLGAIFFLDIKTVQAQNPDDLIVIFKPNPLFSKTNFLPGETINASAEICNKSGESKTIVAEAINVNDPDNFASALNLQIKEGVAAYFNNTLRNFFDSGEVELSSLANNSTTTYDFSITFQAQSGNDYQNKELKNFDLILGFKGEEGGEPSPTPGGGGGGTFSGSVTIGGGGGGGGGVPPGLTILNETVVTATDVSATITWMTSYFSTSQIIYGAEGERHLLDLTDTDGAPPKYGYEHTTPEYNASPKITFHMITIYDLNPGTKYYFRAVSHGSLTISQEHSFITLSKSSLPPSQILAGPSELPSSEGLPSAGPLLGLPSVPRSDLGGNLKGLIPTSQGAPASAGPSDVTPISSDIQIPEAELPVIGEEKMGKTEKSPLAHFLTGAIFPAFKFMGTVWFWIILLITLIILFFLTKKKKKQEEKL